MTTRDAETLAQLVSEQAGKGRKYTFEQLAGRSVDPESGYSPSPNLVWKVASGQDVKMNPPLVRALAAGLNLSPQRVADAAHRQFLGWYAAEPTVERTPEDDADDAVYRAAAAAGVSPEQMPAVEEFFEGLRKEREGEQ